MIKKSRGRQIKSKQKPAIEINDLPKHVELDDEDLDSVTGGTTFRVTTTEPSQIISQPSPPKLGYPEK